MKQLSSYMVLGVGGGDRITYTYDEIDDETGEPISQNNKGNFYAIDPELKVHVDAIKEYIIEHKF